MKILLAILFGWSAIAGPIHIPPERVADLQAALDESGRTGDPVILQGIYVVRTNLTLRGSRIRGTLGSHHGDWNIGSTVIHFHGVTNLPAVRIAQGPTGNPSVVEDIAFVCYHQNAPDAVAIALDSASYGTKLTGILIDRPGIGLLFEPAPSGLSRSLGHRFHNLTIQSFRTAAIHAPSPSRTTDHVFTGLTWLQGTQGADYIAGATRPTGYPVGIDGVPSSSVWDNLLIEDCREALVIRDALNIRIKDLFVDRCRGIVFRRVSEYPGRLYDRTVRIGMLTAYAFTPGCRFAVGDPRIPVSIGMQSLALGDERASWLNSVGPLPWR